MQSVLSPFAVGRATSVGLAVPTRSRTSRVTCRTRRRNPEAPRCQAIQTKQQPALATSSIATTQLPKEYALAETQSFGNADAAAAISADTSMTPTDEASPLSTVWHALSTKISMSDRMKGLLMVNLMTLIMSTNFVVVKDAVELMDPFSFSALRFIIAATPFLPFLTQIKVDRQTINGGLEIGLWMTLSYLTQGVGLVTTDASRVSFLSALTVILVPIIVGLSGRGVSKLAWSSAGLALVGVGLLSGTGLGGSVSSGDLLSLASAAFIAVMVVRAEHYAHIMPVKKRISLLGLSMFIVAISSTILTMGVHPEATMQFMQHFSGFSLQDAKQWMQHVPTEALLYTGFVSTDIVLLIELMALKHVESTDAAIVYTMEPVLGALWAYALLGERWGPNGWIGAALIVGSSFATQIYGSNNSQETECS